MTTESASCSEYYWPYNAVFCCMKFHAEQYFSTDIPLLEGDGGVKASELDARLWKAADLGDLDDLTLALEAGADVNFQHSSGTPLGRAARRGHVECVRRLLAHNADVGMKGRFNCKSCTPLCAAARNGHLEVMRTLLRSGADPKDGALLDAAEYGQLDAVILLLQEGAEVNSRTARGETPLMLAVQKGRLDHIRWVLEGVVDYYYYRGYCYNAVHYPYDAVEFLLNEHKAVDVLDLPELEKLRDALCRDDLPAVKELVQNAGKGDPAAERRLQLVRLLLEWEADPNLQDCDGACALHAATFDKDISCIELLLTRNAAVDILGSVYGNRLAPLHLAAGFYGSKAVVRTLLLAGADPNQLDENSRTPLHQAVSEGDATRVQLLLDAGANVQITDKEGKTPLHYTRTLDKAQLLVNAGADVRAQDFHGRTVLFAAADRQGEGACMDFLISQGADPHARDKNGISALDLALKRWHFEDDDGGIESVRALISHGVVPDKSDIKISFHNAIKRRYLGCAVALIHLGTSVEELLGGNTPLMTAVFCNCSLAVKLLLQEGANPNVECKGKTLLDIALLRGFKDSAKVLLEAGVLPRANVAFELQSKKTWTSYIDLHKGLMIQDKDGITATHFLCHSLQPLSLLERLLEDPTYAHVADVDGATGLHVLALGGANCGCNYARLLLQKGADVNAKDRDGLTPLHCTAFKGYFEMASLLLERGADPNLRDDNGRTALHIAAQYLPHHPTFVDLLLQNSANVEAATQEGWTALHSSTFSGNLVCAQMLVQHGADVNALTHEGATPLSLAKQEGYTACLEWLLEVGAQPTDVIHTPTWDLSKLFRNEAQYELRQEWKSEDLNPSDEDSDEDDFGFGLFD
ncbi:ankyrin-1-like isoform X2 [Periplaneta americana]|uniref:ankyrin-1-like isoform X2 n=1 Tax=Periplaneta americana TaxID=6978 RepID=UPI0037E91DA2